MDYGDSKRSKDLWRRPESPRFVSLSAAAGALIYEGFFALLGWVDDMRFAGMRRWEGDTWSI
mgnify:CR=1 FL=1